MASGYRGCTARCTLSDRRQWPRISLALNPGYAVSMVRYRRNFVAGGTFFFTVTLADRRSCVLIDYVDALRGAFRTTRRTHPFAIDALVILPDHLHVIMSLPEGDADFPNRWHLIKRRFTTVVTKTGTTVARRPNGEVALWQRRFGNTLFATTGISNGTSITSTSIRSSTGWSRECATGRTRRSIVTCGVDCCPAIGPEN